MKMKKKKKKKKKKILNEKQFPLSNIQEPAKEMSQNYVNLPDIF